MSRIEPISRIMGFAKKSSGSWFSTTFNFTNYLSSNSFASETITNIHNFLTAFIVEVKFFCWQMMSHMFRLGKYLKVLYPIISFNIVFMVNYFLREFKFSTEVLLHNIFMFQNSSSININSDVSMFCDSRNIPILKFKSLISLPSSFMHNTTLNRFRTHSRSFTIINLAQSINFSSLHIFSLQQTGRYCQW